jgi:DNA helicase-2/ATP-dependent DNA helicase PcrA
VADPFIPNPRQKQAIDHVSGPMLVLAGAGTGKTTVLVERIARLIENGHAAPEEILAVTFTDNAADELRARVAKRLRRKAAIHAGTFHAYCYGLLKRTGNDFYTLVPEDVWVFLRQRIEQLGLKHFIRPADLGQFLDDLRNFFDRCHEELVSPEQFQEYVDGLASAAELPRNCRAKEVEQLGEALIRERWQEIARVYANSMRLLREKNLGTFGMQISTAVGLLRANEELLEQERRRTKFILIDEFQDCNSSNIILAELLAGEAQNIFAVGDPDQAIYRFRGASSAAFEEFQRKFPETEALTLDENQRSRRNILRVAYSVIRENPGVASLAKKVRFERAELQSGRDRREREQGNLVFDSAVQAVISGEDDQEAAEIAREMESLMAVTGRQRPPSLAILYRQHLHRESMIAELAVRGIPFIVRGSSVMETSTARDFLAAVRAVTNPGDAESLFRVAAFPVFNVPGRELRERLAQARGKEPFSEVLGTMEPGKRVLQGVQEARSTVAQQKLSAAGVFKLVASNFGFDPADPVVKALQRFVDDWEKKPFIESKSVQAFLQYLEYFQQGRGVIPLWTEEDVERAEREHPEAVQLMTVHAAKGLEFDHVWILRVTSNSFPTHYRETLFEFPPGLRSSIAVGDSKEVHEQEERRLFYVAITRARNELAMHGRPGRNRERTPSGFLRPLLTDRNLYGALEHREARESPQQDEAAAGESAVAEWLLMPPAFDAAGMALSANAVESYATCPLRFKLERDWNIPGEAAAAMQYGNAMHTVLRSYYVPRPGRQLDSVEDVLKAFHTEFDKALIDDAVQRRLYENRGEEQLRALIGAQPRGAVDVIDAEAAFEFPMAQRRIKGRIDRLDRVEGKQVRVVDYKTGSPKTQDHADRSLQLSIYAMGAARMGFDPRELVFLNLQGNESVVTRRTPLQLERAEEKILEAAEGMEAGRFDPKPGMHCRWCDYRGLCPATEQRVFVPVKALGAAE